MKRIKILLLIIVIIIPLLLLPNNELKDDYYNYINKKIIEKHKLKNDEYTWSTFIDKQEKVDNKKKEIINKLIENKTNNNISIIYEKLLTKEKGLSTLSKYINIVDNSNNIEDYIKNAIIIEKELNIDIFTNIKVEKDYKDNSKSIIYLYPITMDFGATSDFYANEDYMSYKALIKQYGIKILKQYGYSTKKARDVSKSITNMYTDISNNSLLSKDLEDISKYYNIITKEELKKVYTNIDIDKYLKEKNINEEIFSIIDINNYKTINNYLSNDNLELLKEQLKLKILENYAIFLDNNYSNLIYELNNKLLGKKINNEEEKIREIIDNYFNNEIDKIYKENNISQEKVDYINKMTKEIINYYKKNIDTLDWLSKETRKKAKLKLNNMKINIGVSNYNNYDYNLNENNTLIENIITIEKYLYNYELSKLKTNKQDNLITETTVNAYYNPQDNSINIPISSFTLFDEKDNYYKNLGSIGMIIAHEITHAFDYNGSKFDDKGNINNWWQEEDYNIFKKKQQDVIKYYNKYEVVKGSYINGRKTVNENIADLGAVSCISGIAESKKAKKEEIKHMYKSLANLWASIEKEEYKELLLLQDNHSPSKYRVNGTLSSTELFYKTYNINSFNKMYISPKKRVKVW
ncbi:MAG: M13 family metallopeptidase [Bacilli bacterium]|nr:M13 family metallopeptidase [Bacilli bacterium]